MQKDMLLYTPEADKTNLIGWHIFCFVDGFQFPDGTYIPANYVLGTVSPSMDEPITVMCMMFPDEPVLVAIKMGIDGKTFLHIDEIEVFSDGGIISKIKASTITSSETATV